MSDKLHHHVIVEGATGTLDPRELERALQLRLDKLPGVTVRHIAPARIGGRDVVVLIATSPQANPTVCPDHGLWSCRPCKWSQGVPHNRQFPEAT